MKYLIIEHTTEKCETIYEKKCDFDLDKDWCDNCAELYEGESQYIMDELIVAGYEVWDIAECYYEYGRVRHWWVKVDCKKTRQPDLRILIL